MNVVRRNNLCLTPGGPGHSHLGRSEAQSPPAAPPLADLLAVCREILEHEPLAPELFDRLDAAVRKVERAADRAEALLGRPRRHEEHEEAQRETKGIHD